MEIKNFADRWPEWKEKLKKEYPHLTEEDLRYEIGKDAELLKRLQEKMGKTDKEITNWLHLMG
jgi:hypothetical protein